MPPTPKANEEITLDLSEKDLEIESPKEGDDPDKAKKDPDGGEDNGSDDDNNDALNEVLEKPVEELTDDDKALIKKSADKLSEEQKEKFKDIIGDGGKLKESEYTKERFDGLMSRMNKDKAD